MQKPKSIPLFFWQGLKYSLVGFINTLFCIGCIVFFLDLGLHYVASTSLAYLIAFVVGFFLNLSFTFRVSDRIFSRFVKFLIIALISLAVTQGVQLIAIEWFSTPLWLGVALGMVCYTLLSFFLNVFVVFKPTYSPSPSDK